MQDYLQVGDVAGIDELDDALEQLRAENEMLREVHRLATIPMHCICLLMKH